MLNADAQAAPRGSRRVAARRALKTSLFVGFACMVFLLAFPVAVGLSAALVVLVAAIAVVACAVALVAPPVAFLIGLGEFRAKRRAAL